MNPRLTILALCLTSLVCHAQTPAIPEPPLVLYGTATDAATAQPVAITSIAWQVEDGTASATYSAATVPATRTISQDGQTLYLLEVPFETREVQTPGGPQSRTATPNTFALGSAGPAYTLTATLNGQETRIRAIDGVLQTANPPAFTLSNYTSATQGRMIQVDLWLGVPGTSSGYDAWAIGYFGSATVPQAARSADPDSDRLTNEEEFKAGTDPTNPHDRLRILSFFRDAPGTTAQLTWASKPGITYQIEASPDLSPLSWTTLTAPITASAPTTQSVLTLPADSPPNFYRVVVIEN